jgi:UDP-glucuronate 4-epimerase
MAYFKFTKAILAGEPIDVYNYGDMKRDFTYIDDIVEGVVRVIDRIPEPQHSEITNATAPYKIYNIGNNKPVTLRSFITAIEGSCGAKAIEKHLPMQPGDVPITYADIDDLIKDVGFKPVTTVEEGISKFMKWYRDYYDI